MLLNLKQLNRSVLCLLALCCLITTACVTEHSKPGLYVERRCAVYSIIETFLLGASRGPSSVSGCRPIPKVLFVSSKRSVAATFPCCSTKIYEEPQIVRGA